MKRIVSKLHLWVSVPFGLVIMITCFTGALLVFEKEITAVYYDSVADVEPVGSPMSLGDLLPRVLSTLPAGAEVSGVVVPSGECDAYKVNVKGAAKATLYVNQYTGEVLGEYKRLEFFRVVLRLHRWLLDASPKGGGVFWGKSVVGASVLAFVFILLSGLVLWWPRNRKMLANRLKVVWSKGINRFWYDLHVAGGFYVLMFLLVMAVTGLTWSYRWYSNGFYSLLGANAGGKQVVEPIAVADVSSKGNTSGVDAVSVATATAVSSRYVDGTTGATAVSVESLDAVSGATAQSSAVQWSPYTAWDKALGYVCAEYASFAQVTVGDGTATVLLDHVGNRRASDKYTFDTVSGDMTTVARYEGAPSSNKARGWVYSLHVGSWGGLFSKVLYFIAALMGAALPLIGYYLWIRRLYLKRKSK